MESEDPLNCAAYHGGACAVAVQDGIRTTVVGRGYGIGADIDHAQGTASCAIYRPWYIHRELTALFNGWFLTRSPYQARTYTWGRLGVWVHQVLRLGNASSAAQYEAQG